MDNKITTVQAEALIREENQKWFCEIFGLVPHTLYTRIVKHNWKKSEIIAINLYYQTLIIKGNDQANKQS